MKKIGLVTFWDFNYGSSLQCYATKHVLENMGYWCELLEKNQTGKKQVLFNRVKKLFVLPLKSILYPGFARNYLMMRKSARIANAAISEGTREKIHFFGKTVLQPRRLSKKMLKQLGNSEDYAAFITGSDQVWGGHFIEPTYGNFLEFAPRHKRIAYAVSFGSSRIENYNRIRYHKGIRGIDAISVREESGKQIVSSITHKPVAVMPDPTVLLTRQEWEAFAQKGVQEEQSYLLVHFLDKISPRAISILKQKADSTELMIVCLGWRRTEIADFGHAKFVDGDPHDYISLIQNADAVFTDSFHTTLFSLRFNKQLYVFERSYAHGFSQSTRITNLLERCGCKDRYILETASDGTELPIGEICCDAFFQQERERGLHFLQDCLSTLDLERGKACSCPNLKPDNECCGCAACAEICPRQAITMKANRFGYLLPVVDKEKCIQCGLCEKVCRKIIPYPNTSPRGFIAYTSNEKLLSQSTSGGVFSTVAQNFIQDGGTVYGAVLHLQPDGARVNHEAADTWAGVVPMLGSKYVQSSIQSVFNKVKEDLTQGKKVLFSGTSCQIDAIYRFLGGKPDNLYTIDLVCHGVPGESFFSDYITFLEKKNHSSIVNFTFREKQNGAAQYIERVTYKNGKITAQDGMQSLYYKMFFGCESYRAYCYCCPFASLQKPADLTLGDYYESRKDYPELYTEDGPLYKRETVSCVIAHNTKGEQLLHAFGDQLNLIEVDASKIQNSHDQLCFPSMQGEKRDKYFEMYERGGVVRLYRYHQFIRLTMIVPNIIKKATKRILRCIDALKLTQFSDGDKME